MALIKSATYDNKEHESWVHRHPLLASGIALTGGLAMADAGTRVFANAYKNHGLGKALFEGASHTAAEGGREGLVYGSLLSIAEPTILHGVLGQPVHGKKQQ